MFLKYLHENDAKPTQNPQKQTLSGVVKKRGCKKTFYRKTPELKSLFEKYYRKFSEEFWSSISAITGNGSQGHPGSPIRITKTGLVRSATTFLHGGIAHIEACYMDYEHFRAILSLELEGNIFNCTQFGQLGFLNMSAICCSYTLKKSMCSQKFVCFFFCFILSNWNFYEFRYEKGCDSIRNSFDCSRNSVVLV